MSPVWRKSSLLLHLHLDFNKFGKKCLSAYGIDYNRRGRLIVIMGPSNGAFLCLKDVNTQQKAS